MKQVVKLGSLELALEKTYEISQHASNSQITQTDYLNAIRHVQVSRDVRDALNRVDVRDEEPKLNTWTVTGKGVYVGAWSKRLSKFIYKKHNVKLDPQTLSVISERVMRTLDGTREDFLFEFSTELWTPGEFGEKENSCWFGSRQYGYCSTGLIKTGQGGAVKIYDVSGFRRARCWFYNLEGSLLLFNAYDTQKKLDILGISRMLSIRFGMDYRKHTEVIADDAYINGKSIYAIGNPPISRPITLDFAMRAHRPVPVLHDLEFRIPGNKECPSCGNETNELIATLNGQGCKRCVIRCSDCDQPNLLYHTYSTWDDKHVCAICLDNYTECDNGHLYPSNEDECPRCNDEDYGDTFLCSYCEEQCTGDSISIHGGDVVCQSCLDDHYSYCERCDEFHYSDHTNWVESVNEVVCDNCLENEFTKCNRCHNYYLHTDVTEVEESFLCPTCTDEISVSCDRCDTQVYEDHTVLVYINDDQDVETWCEGCADEHATHCEMCGEYYSDNVEHSHDEEADDED